MQREQLEHLIRAASAITNEYELVVVGSQSILGALPNAPQELLLSMEADVYPLHRPELADLIDGAIGEMSPFEERFGYYAQGVGPETSILPPDWHTRTIKIQNQNTDLKIAYCLEPHDLAASKLAAGRDKDWVFVRVMLLNKLIDPQVLVQRIAQLPIGDVQKEILRTWVLSQNRRFPPSGE